MWKSVADEEFREKFNQDRVKSNSSDQPFLLFSSSISGDGSLRHISLFLKGLMDLLYKAQTLIYRSHLHHCMPAYFYVVQLYLSLP